MNEKLINKPEEIRERIQVLQVYLKSFREATLSNYFVINGILLDRIPIPQGEAKKTIVSAFRDIISQEIERLQIRLENNTPEDLESIISESPDPQDEIRTQEEISLDLFKSVKFLLLEAYFSEFEVIDRLSQHANGWNFKEWLTRKDLIL